MSSQLIGPSFGSLYEILKKTVRQFRSDNKSELVFNPFKEDINNIQQEFQTFYENQEFTDFEIKVEPNGQSIKVHKIYLIISKFQAIAECIGNSFTIDGIGDKKLIKSLIDCYYRLSLDITVNEDNIVDMISIAEQFKIKDLSKSLSEFKNKIHSTDQWFQKLDESQQKVFKEYTTESLKRTADFEDSEEKTVRSKRLKTSIDKSDTKVEESVDKSDTKVEESVDKSDTKVEESVNKSDTKVKESVDKSDTKVKESVDKSDTKVKESVDKSDTKVEESVNKSDNKVKESVDKSDTKVKESVDKSDNKVEESVNKSDTKVEESVNKSDNKVKESVDKSDTKVEESVNKSDNKVKESVDKSDTKVKESVNKSDTKVKESVNKLDTKVKESVEIRLSEESDYDQKTEFVDQKPVSGSVVNTNIVTKRNTNRRLNFDPIKVIKLMEKPSNRKHPLSSKKIQELTNNRLKSNQTKEDKPKEDIPANYCFEKFVSHSKTESTQIWKSRFVPNNCSEDQLVAVIGGPFVKWYDLNQLVTEKTSSGEHKHVFESPNGTDFRSIAVTKITNPSDDIIYAIGTIGLIYVFRHPEQKSITKYNIINSVIKENEEVMDIVFNITDINNYLICGTSEKNIYVYHLKFNSNDLSLAKFMDRHSTDFPIVSIVYIEKYDCLVASGESHRLVLWKDILKFRQNRLIRTTIPNHLAKAISSLVYIPEEDLICLRIINTGYLLLGQMDQIINKFSLNNRNKDINLQFVHSVKLQHNRCLFDSQLVEFIDIGFNSGLICCGDSSGNIYVYRSDQLKTIKAKESVEPIQVISYDDWKLSPPIIRSVSISDDLKYLVVTTNQNMVGVCRPLTVT